MSPGRAHTALLALCIYQCSETFATGTKPCHDYYDLFRSQNTSIAIFLAHRLPQANLEEAYVHWENLYQYVFS